MKVERIRVSRAPGPREFELRPGEGLAGWVGGTARDRRLLLELLVGSLGLGARDGPPPSGEDGPSSVTTRAVLDLDGTRVELVDGSGGTGPGREDPARLLGLTRRELALVWAGRPGDAGPTDLLEEGARVLARLRGLGRVSAALDRLGQVRGGPEEGSDPEERDRLETELAEVEAELHTLEEVPARLEALETELRDLRSRVAEVSGDLEAANEEWLRERQDAETHLHACRDRARELRGRMRRMEEEGRAFDCPFCGRALGDRHGAVLDGLREEWERLVQDGRWWRRRREQLEEEPSHVRQLEDRALRLRAEIEERAERLERWRFALRRRDELRERHSELSGALGGEGRREPEAPEAAPAGPEGERRSRLRAAFAAARDELLDEERDAVARRCGAYLNRMSGGRILGIARSSEGGPLPIEDGRPVRNPGEEDRLALTIALRLALGVRLVAAGIPLRSLLLGEPLRALDFETGLRTVELLRSLRKRIPQLLLLGGEEVVEAAPERFDRIFEFVDDRHRGRPAVRAMPGGVGTLVLTDG